MQHSFLECQNIYLNIKFSLMLPQFYYAYVCILSFVMNFLFCIYQLRLKIILDFSADSNNLQYILNVLSNLSSVQEIFDETLLIE